MDIKQKVSPKVIFAKKQQSCAILGRDEDFCGGDGVNMSQRVDGTIPRSTSDY